MLGTVGYGVYIYLAGYEILMFKLTILSKRKRGGSWRTEHTYFQVLGKEDFRVYIEMPRSVILVYRLSIFSSRKRTGRRRVCNSCENSIFSCQESKAVSAGYMSEGFCNS